jgi:hypothetical protein
MKINSGEVSLRKNDVKVIAFSILIRNRCPPFGKG